MMKNGPIDENDEKASLKVHLIKVILQSNNTGLLYCHQEIQGQRDEISVVDGGTTDGQNRHSVRVGNDPRFFLGTRYECLPNTHIVRSDSSTDSYLLPWSTLDSIANMWRMKHTSVHSENNSK